MIFPGMFQAGVIDPIKERLSMPERLTSEWRVISEPTNGKPEQQFTTEARMVAEKGRNGLYRIYQQEDIHNFYGEGYNGKYNPHGIVKNVLSRFFGNPDGEFSREDAIDTLARFEQHYPRRAPNRTLHGRILHHTAC